MSDKISVTTVHPPIVTQVFDTSTFPTVGLHEKLWRLIDEGWQFQKPDTIGDGWEIYRPEHGPRHLTRLTDAPTLADTVDAAWAAREAAS